MAATLLKYFCLLLSLSVASANTDCSFEIRTVTVQLSRAHILRTWQPDGAHCRWWSETNQFPAAVRSGPRWLVMQLRQPMMLEEVMLQGWDGQWQAAAPVGSPVSALGASSLPLELQLEDPCRASWETFGSSDRWRQLGGAGDVKFQIPTSFIRLSSESSLSWQALQITGRKPSMQLNVSLSSKYLYRSYGITVRKKVQSRMAFIVDSCIDGQAACWLLGSGRRLTASLIGSEVDVQSGMRINKFELLVGESDHGSVLQCGSAGLRTALLEELLLWEVPARTLELSVAQMLVVGFPAVVNISSDSYPGTRHRCSIIRPTGLKRNLTLSYQESSVAIDFRDRTVIRVRSEFRFTVQAADRLGELSCTGSVSSGADVIATRRLLNISEPCKTTADLGRSRHWLVGDFRRIIVTSSNCSVWNVSHNCRLVVDDEASPVPLWKVLESSFSSTHVLHVREAMTRTGWKILCSISQSGLAYQDLEIDLSSAPVVFGASDRASLDIVAEKSCKNVLQVQAIIKNKQEDMLPVTNVTCQAVSNTKQYLAMQRTDWDTWSSLTYVTESKSLRNHSVRCAASQFYLGESVFQTVAEVPVAVDGCYCTSRTNLIYYALVASATQVVVILVVAMATWRLAMSRARRPAARPLTPRLDKDRGLPPVPLQTWSLTSSPTGRNYENLTSERGTADDSAYEHVSDGTCSSRRVDGNEVNYINSRARGRF